MSKRKTIAETSLVGLIVIILTSITVVYDADMSMTGLIVLALLGFLGLRLRIRKGNMELEADNNVDAIAR